MSSSSTKRAGEVAFSKMEKFNAELFTLTYGALVAQLVRDFEDYGEVEKQLGKMGYNIGTRLVDEFLAKAGSTKCSDFRETMDAIAKVAFKMFLNVGASVSNWNAEHTECSLTLDENPLNDFVELPDAALEASFHYSNVLCGVIRGALEMLQLRVECSYVRCTLLGDDSSEIRVVLKEIMSEELVDGYAE